MKKSGGSLGLVTDRAMQKSIKETRRQWLVLACAVVLMLGSIFSSRAFAATCEVGDLSKGYWKMVGAPYKGECIIPGPPHPDSAFLHGRVNGAFRIEGKYKVVTVLSGKGCSNGYAECVFGCISGFSEWACVGVYDYMDVTYEPNGQLCLWPDQNNDGVPDNCACFTDGNAVTLYEWVWTNKDCNKEEPPPAPANTPNLDPGKPDCPQTPLN